MRVAVIGAGIGGLAAALRVARAGHDVTLVEARPNAGGLAGSVELHGVAFDAGPYVLLDRPGLEWAFAQLGVALPELDRLNDVVYEVSWPDGPAVTIYADAARTAADVGGAYVAFVDRMRKTYERLAPLLRVSHPTPLSLVRHGAAAAAPFLLRSLGDVMRRSGLPPRAVEALTIWTHVARQHVDHAPSPMAFVPALIHTHGAWLPRGGTSAIARTLVAAAAHLGIAFRYGTRVTAIETRDGRVVALRTADDRIEADAVISDANAIGTYVELLDATPRRKRERLERIPLQSPGACAYLAITSHEPRPYLRFRLGEPLGCRLLVNRGTSARLILPIAHERAQALGRDGQLRLLDAALDEPWWRDGIASFEVLEKRTPADWGERYTLYRDSMNAAMTASLMRSGRIEHRSPDARGLYLAGSSTHPGQWISFCATSGVLAADALLEDAR